MNNTLLFALLMSTLIVSSCSSYKEYDEASFANYAWEPEQVITFNPVIEDSSQSYRLGFGIRHVYGMSNSVINITIKSTSPSGTIVTRNYDFTIKNEKGVYVSSCAGDMCDLETFVDDDFNFEEKGEYTITLTHNGKYSISGVMAFGLILDKN